MILKLEITEELDYVGYFNKKDNPLIISFWFILRVNFIESDAKD